MNQFAKQWYSIGLYRLGVGLRRISIPMHTVRKHSTAPFFIKTPLYNNMLCNKFSEVFESQMQITPNTTKIFNMLNNNNGNIGIGLFQYNSASTNILNEKIINEYRILSQPQRDYINMNISCEIQRVQREKILVNSAITDLYSRVLWGNLALGTIGYGFLYSIPSINLIFYPVIMFGMSMGCAGIISACIGVAYSGLMYNFIHIYYKLINFTFAPIYFKYKNIPAQYDTRINTLHTLMTLNNPDKH